MRSPGRELEVEIGAIGQVAVASVRGEVDLDAKERLERALEPIRAGSGAAVVDLADVPFMDSSGLHVIVGLRRQLEQQGRTLGVSCKPGGVRDVFALTSLDEVMPLYPDAATAARELAGGDGLSEEAF